MYRYVAMKPEGEGCHYPIPGIHCQKAIADNERAAAIMACHLSDSTKKMAEQGVQELGHELKELSNETKAA